MAATPGPSEHIDAPPEAQEYDEDEGPGQLFSIISSAQSPVNKTSKWDVSVACDMVSECVANMSSGCIAKNQQVLTFACYP